MSAPEYPRGTEGGDDFDFDGDTNKDDASMGGRARGFSGGLGGFGNGAGANPHFSHAATGLGGDATMAQEKEDIDLRGRVLLEQLENRGGMDPQNTLRIGGNHFNINDPNKPPYTPFYLMVTGHV